MNDELQKSLAAILSKTTSAAEAGVSFLQGQIPDVIHQLLVWKEIESGLYFLLSGIATPVLWRMGVKVWKSDDDWQDGLGNPLAMFPAFGAIASAAICLCSLDWLQILVAPKIYLIEYAAHLAK